MVHRRTEDLKNVRPPYFQNFFKLFRILNELDPSVTLDDIRDLTMREIQDLIDEYSAPAEESGSVGTSTGSQYEPESGHHGSDYGNSHENRHNRSRHEHE